MKEINKAIITIVVIGLLWSVILTMSHYVFVPPLPGGVSPADVKKTIDNELTPRLQRIEDEVRQLHDTQNRIKQEVFDETILDK